MIKLNNKIWLSLCSVILLFLAVAFFVPVIMTSPEDNRSMPCDWQATQDFNNYSQALERYKLDNYQYPTTQQGLEALFSLPTIPPMPVDWNGPYLKNVINDPWGSEYHYEAGTDDFIITSLGADRKSGGSDCDSDLMSDLGN